MGASSAGKVRQNRDFQPMSRFVSEMIQDRAEVALTGSRI